MRRPVKPVFSGNNPNARDQLGGEDLAADLLTCGSYHEDIDHRSSEHCPNTIKGSEEAKTRNE